MKNHKWKKVVLFSGHMIDRPGRRPERFPPRKETVVRDAIIEQLEKWSVDKEDLCICGGARGGDILFAEACLNRGARVKLLVPLPQDEFLDESVRLPNSDWEKRFFRLRDKCEIQFQHEALGNAPAGTSIFARNNDWSIETARNEAGPAPLYALLVWDQQKGEGPGGTSDVAEKVKAIATAVKIVNPTNLEVSSGETHNRVLAPNHDKHLLD